MVIPQFSHEITKEFKAIHNLVFGDSLSVNKETYTIYLTVLLNGKPISCCEIIEVDPENYLIANLAVHPQLRHQQIAQYTIRFAETKIRDIGGTNSLIRVEPAFEIHYKKLGYHEHLGGEIIFEQDVSKIEMLRVLRKKQTRK